MNLISSVRSCNHISCHSIMPRNHRRQLHSLLDTLNKLWLIQNLQERFFQRRKVCRHGIPNYPPINTRILVRCPVTHVDNLQPRNLEILFTKIPRKFACGFTDIFQLLDYCILAHPLCAEGLVGNATNVLFDLSNAIEDFAQVNGIISLRHRGSLFLSQHTDECTCSRRRSRRDQLYAQVVFSTRLPTRPI